MRADCSFLAGKPGDPGRPAADNRLFLEAVLRIARTGASRRDLPDPFGLWNFFRRFRRWTLKGVFESLLALSGDPDFEYAIIDGTIVRAHQYGAGAKGGRKIRPLALILSRPEGRVAPQDRRNVTRSAIS
jgi:transposase